MPTDEERQAAYEELGRRGAFKTPEQKAAVAELARRGVIRPPKNAPGKPAYTTTREGRSVTPYQLGQPSSPAAQMLAGGQQFPSLLPTNPLPQPQTPAAPNMLQQAQGVVQRGVAQGQETNIRHSALGNPLPVPTQSKQEKSPPYFDMNNFNSLAGMLAIRMGYASDGAQKRFYKVMEARDRVVSGKAQAGDKQMMSDWWNLPISEKLGTSDEKVGEILTIGPLTATHLLPKDHPLQQVAAGIRKEMGGSVTPSNLAMVGAAGLAPQPLQQFVGQAFAAQQLGTGIPGLFQAQNPEQFGRAATQTGMGLLPLAHSALSAKPPTAGMKLDPIRTEGVPGYGAPKPTYRVPGSASLPKESIAADTSANPIPTPKPVAKPVAEPIPTPKPAPKAPPRTPAKAPERPAQPSKTPEPTKTPPSPKTPQKTAPKPAATPAPEPPKSVYEGSRYAFEAGSKLLKETKTAQLWQSSDTSSYIVRNAAGDTVLTTPIKQRAMTRFDKESMGNFVEQDKRLLLEPRTDMLTTPDPATQSKPTPKQPWQMTREEWAKSAPRSARGDGFQVEFGTLKHSAGVAETGKPGYNLEESYKGNGWKVVTYRGVDGKVLGVLEYSTALDYDYQVSPGKRVAGHYNANIQVSVDPSARRQGIATRLYDFAKKQGIDVDAATGKEGYTEAGAGLAHKRAVTNALASGKSVPPGVLAEYPDLIGKSPIGDAASKPAKKGWTDRELGVISGGLPPENNVRYAPMSGPRGWTVWDWKENKPAILPEGQTSGEMLHDRAIDHAKELNEKESGTWVEPVEAEPWYKRLESPIGDSKPAAAPANKPPVAKPTPVEALHTAAEEAKARVAAKRAARKESGSGNVSSGPNIFKGLEDYDLKDLLTIGADHIAQGATRFTDWSVKMVEDFGEAVKPHLQALWDRSVEHYDKLSPIGGSGIGSDTPPTVTGIAQRITGTPSGKGVSTEEGIAQGQARIKAGEDPEAHLSTMEKRGNYADREDFNLLRAHRDNLAVAADKAYDAWQKAPLDTRLKDAYNAANDAVRKWDTRLKPYQTEWSNVGTMMQGETALDTGSFTSTQRNFESRAGRPMTEGEKRVAKQQSEYVTQLETDLKESQAKVDTQVKKQAEAQAKRQAKSPNTIPKDVGGLRQHIADRIKAGTFYLKQKLGGRPGAPAGAINIAPQPVSPDIVRAVWAYAKETYIDKGTDFEATVKGVGTDLGLSHDQVMEILAGDKQMKTVTNDMWKKQSKRRQAVNMAKAWVEAANTPGYARIYKQITNFPRSIAVYGHGAVGMITHAGPNIARPSAWSTYFPHLLKQWKYVLDSGYHEQMMRQMEMDNTSDNSFADWRRAGLANDPNEVYDDMQAYQQSFQKAGVLDKAGEKIAQGYKAGNRGMDALKTFRFEYAKKLWNDMPQSTKKLPGMRKAMADWVNHATGVGKFAEGKTGKFFSELMFAPSLEASRWARTIGDPIKTGKALLDPKASPTDKAIARFRVKQASQLIAVYAGALAVNYGANAAFGDKEDNVNFLDPTKSDWLHFKWGGRTADVTGNVTAAMKFLAEVFSTITGAKPTQFYEKGKSKQDILSGDAGFYARGKLSPMYGVSADVATQRDALGRPLPYTMAKPTANHPAFTPTEYASQHLPIPLAGAVEEVYDDFREAGMEPDKAKVIIDFLTTGALEATGTKLGKTPKTPTPPTRATKSPYDYSLGVYKPPKN